MKAFSFSPDGQSIAGLPVMVTGRMRAPVQSLGCTPFCVSENERKKRKKGLEIKLIEKVPHMAGKVTHRPCGASPLPRIICNLVRSHITHLKTGETRGCLEMGCRERWIAMGHRKQW